MMKQIVGFLSILGFVESKPTFLWDGDMAGSDMDFDIDDSDYESS
jgi:hypothetical protein